MDTAYKMIGHKGQSVLVEEERAGILRRAYIPTGAPLNAEEFDRGIPYGENWSAELEGAEFDVQAFTLALRRSGVWTRDQLRRNPVALRSAIMEGARAIISTVTGGR